MSPKSASPNPCEAIKQCLSLDTCSSLTVSLLNEILAPRLAPSATTGSKLRSSRPATTTTKPASRARQASGKPPTLTIMERSRLAAEVINCCLRSLSDSSKATVDKSAPSATPTEAALKARPTSKPIETSAKVLKSRSGNSGDVPADSIEHLADCCSTAISFLISIESAEDIPPIQHLQTENARLSLSLKLIQLKRFGIALDELSILKRRLQLIMLKETGGSEHFDDQLPDVKNLLLTKIKAGGKENGVAFDIKTNREALSTLLEFPQVSTSNSAFPLVISYQLGVLRCIAGLKQPRVLETILPSLSSQSSPLGFIKVLSRSSSSKALTHVGTLSQILVSLTPSTSVNADIPASSNQAACTPGIAILIQTLYLECLVIQRELCPEEKSKNLWELSAKYLAAYIRRTPSQNSKGKRDRYTLVRDVAYKVKALLVDQGVDDSLPLEIYKLLSWVASDANLLAESFRWTEEWLSALNKDGDKSNAALVALCKVRLMVSELKAFRLSQADATIPRSDNIRRLEERAGLAVEELENVTRGRKQDLESLLQEVGQLRRNSMSLLAAFLKQDGHESSVSADDLMRERTFRCLYNRVIKSVVQFCRKYMAMDISEEEKSRLRSILVPAIDIAVSACSRGFDIEDSELWDRSQALLYECWSAINVLSREGPDMVDHELYEKLSNAYWRIFLLSRKCSASNSKTIGALRKSISAMDDRPTPELIKASIFRKWEILGNIYLTARDYRRAEETFLSAIKIAANTGLLNELGERATNGESIEQLINSPEKEIASLGLVLTGLIKISNKKRGEEYAALRFDIHNLSTAARGCLLEWVFSLALDQMGDDGSVVRTIGERLLDNYELEEMPIRRSRVVAALLGLSIDQPGLLSSEEVGILGEEILEWASSMSSSDLDEDRSLELFKDDVIANCSIGLAFFGWMYGTTRSDLMLAAFHLWKGIIKHEREWDRISRRINTVIVVKRLEMTVEFLSMKGEDDLRLAALELLLEFRNLERPLNYNALVSIYTALGLQYLRLGYSGKAGISLGKAQAWLKKTQDEITTATQLEWHLAYTEYLVGIGNLDRGLQYFDAAGIIVSQDEDLNSAKQSGARIANRVKVNRAIADAAYVTSLIAFEKGNANESLLHIRRCVRLNTRAWAGLENLSKDSKRQAGDSPSENLQTLSLGVRSHPTTYDALSLPKLWALVPSLYLGYMQTANIYRHLGMIRESIFFIEQALKMVEAVNAKPSIHWAKVILGDLKIRCGQLKEGTVILETVGQLAADGRTIVALEIAMGNLKRLGGDFKGEIEAYQRAEKTMDELVNMNISQIVCDSQDKLAEQLEGLKVTEEENIRTSRPKTPTRSRSKATRPKTPTRRGGKITAPTAKPSPKKPSSSIANECTTLLKQKGDIQRLIAHCLALQGECEFAAVTLEKAANLPAGNQEIISQGLVEAMNYLQKAFSLVSSDPVFSVLQESTISLPSIALSIELAGSSISSPAKKSTRKAVIKKTKAFIDVLELARDCLFKVHSKAMNSGSSTMVPKVSSLLTSIIVLLSAMKHLKGKGPEHPLFASYSLELQKGLATQREKLVVETEKLATLVNEDLQWPEIDATYATMAKVTPFEFSSFQSEYIDIIPKQWATVSVSMSENRKELYITRFQAGQSQLMVRLPLNRHNSRDAYLDLIEYDTVVRDLEDVIQQSNTNTHVAKFMENKADRAQWWGERGDLDNRLEDLLDTIERGWLGGFKGIFSQYPKNPALFAIFQTTFEKILSKLPSRKKKRSAKVDIDPRILELFIALGDPEGQDLDEALTDLIYFVVDILQFHGEGNAYDEIDIDPMVIAMTGALTSYHEEATLDPEHMEAEVDHTILILDKSVQMFPWESMPCLRGHSVSRLPSLATLRNLIVQMKGTGPQNSRPGHYIKRTSGGYILNPDSDLKNTQKMFESDLKALPGQWTGIVDHAPTEEEFHQILVSKDLLLYFGHGSGSHYIPAKTIRKLDRCAVTCLMGCSSGNLKDAGEFEPYGMPTNYMVAGCPAVLANLWDVTDKDIDKFTKEVFEKWGLFGKKQGKSLVEAVAGARDKCVMKYLNGAAPVVYGIPAYFG